MIATCPSCKARLKITPREADPRTLARTSDPDTSAAAVPSAVRRRQLANRLMTAYAIRGPMTAVEASAFIGEPTAWRRVSELAQAGYLETTGHVRRNPSGKLAQLYRVASVEAC